MKWKPIIRPYDKDECEVVELFIAYGNGVPKGFIFDGASIPRALWTTTGSPFMPQYIGPALIHDYLYRTKEVSRKKADDLFRTMLKENGVSAYQRNKMYAAVRTFGWMFYGKGRK